MCKVEELHAEQSLSHYRREDLISDLEINEQSVNEPLLMAELDGMNLDGKLFNS